MPVFDDADAVTSIQVGSAQASKKKATARDKLKI